LRTFQKGKNTVYHKDYQFKQDGILYKQESLPNGHPQQTITNTKW